MAEKLKKVLVVEDEGPLREVVTANLEENGFIALGAGDGKEGLNVALVEHPDLILLDIIMPKMDGVAMLKELRKDDWGKDVPVIMLTNLEDSGKVAEATEAGAYDYLIKIDWKLQDVVNKIKEKLGMPR